MKTSFFAPVHNVEGVWFVCIIHFSQSNILGGHFGVFNSRRHFPPTSLLSLLALGPTVILRVYSCLDLGSDTGRLQMCRFSKLLLLFFFCKGDGDRLMKRASYSCCIFLWVVLAATYLKYRRYRLSCLQFVWHFRFIVTPPPPPPTHTQTRSHSRG